MCKIKVVLALEYEYYMRLNDSYPIVFKNYMSASYLSVLVFVCRNTCKMVPLAALHARIWNLYGNLFLVS